MIMLARTAFMRIAPFFPGVAGPIQFVGSNTANMVGPGTFTLPLSPIGMQQNDLCIVMMTTQSPGAPTNAGWTQIHTPTGRLAAGWKAMGGTPDSSISWSVIPTNFSAAAIAFAFRNCDVAAAANPIEQVVTASGSSGAPDPPAFDTFTFPDECLVICATGQGLDASVGTPAGYSNPVVASNAAGTDDAQICAAYQIQVGQQGAVKDPPSFSGWTNAQSWNAWSIALIRAGTGGPALRDLGPERSRYTLEPDDEQHRNQQRARQAYTRRKRLLR